MNKKLFVFGTIILVLMFFIALSVIKQGFQITIEPNQKSIVEAQPVYLPVTENDPMFGNPGAPTTITEFFSLECTDCAKRHAEIISYIEKNPGKARLLVKGVAKEDWLGNKKIFPLLALMCAQDQNRYWDFLNQAIKFNKFDQTTIDKLITDLNLDALVFNNCLQNKKYESTIENEQINLKILGFVETPNIFVNNKKVNLTDDLKLSDIFDNAVAQ